MSEPNRKIRKRDSSTETDEETTVEVSVLASINSKLAILELLHIDIRDLKASLEFSQSQIETLMLDNIELKKTHHTSPLKSQNSPKKIKLCKKPYWTSSVAACAIISYFLE